MEAVYTVTYRPTAIQRRGKHIPAEAYARKNKTSVATERISKQAFSTIEAVFSVDRAERL
jgi:hypothetical protein